MLRSEVRTSHLPRIKVGMIITGAHECQIVKDGFLTKQGKTVKVCCHVSVVSDKLMDCSHGGDDGLL